jgi:hypothetical protein
MSEHEHTKTDGLGDSAIAADPWRARPRSERMAADKVECNACPVLCQISDGKVGACDRYANRGGQLVRLDPVLVLARTQGRADAGPDDVVPFLPRDTPAPAQTGGGAQGDPASPRSAPPPPIPDYKPAPFIVSSPGRRASTWSPW